MTNLPNFSYLSALLLSVARAAGNVRGLPDAAISATSRSWARCPLSAHARAAKLVQHFESYYDTCRVVASSVEPAEVADRLAQLDAVELRGRGMPAVRIAPDRVSDPRLGFSEETILALAAGEIVSLPGRQTEFYSYDWLKQLVDDGLAALFPAQAYEVAKWLANEIEGRRVEPNIMLDTLARVMGIGDPLFGFAKRILLERDGCLLLYAPALFGRFRLIRLSIEPVLVWPEE